MTRDVRTELAEIVESYADAWWAMMECASVGEDLRHRSLRILTEDCVRDILDAMAIDVAEAMNEKGDTNG